MSGHRLDVHVAKGVTDGLFISSVGCAGELWAVIMDAGTGFTSQVYSVTPNAFLPKEWIMDKWDQGFYITAVAGIMPFSPFPPFKSLLTFLQECHVKILQELIFPIISQKLCLCSQPAQPMNSSSAGYAVLIGSCHKQQLVY